MRRAGSVRSNTDPSQPIKESAMVESLNVDLETVCFVIFKSREFEAQEGPMDENPGSNASDDGFREVLASHGDDQTYNEIKEMIDALNVAEQSALVAISWVGRGDFTGEEWEDSYQLARERHTEQTAEYLLGMPLLSEYLQNGLSEMGLSCADYEKEHL